MAAWLVLVGLIVLGAPALFQDRLLYIPAKATVAEVAVGGLQAWPSGDDFRGLLASPAGELRATAIVFHGNAGHAGHRAFFAQALAPLGVRVILAEYPAYGPRQGQVGEASLVADAAETIGLAHSRYGAPLLVIGESLGAGVAAAAAARQSAQVAALWLITPWDRLEHVASFHYPWLPVGWLLRDRYDSAQHLVSFAQPVLITVAERDDIVPARFGRALYEALPQPKRLEVLTGAGHNDWLKPPDSAWWRQQLDFLLPGAAAR